jgi:hypothetical protein
MGLSLNPINRNMDGYVRLLGWPLMDKPIVTNKDLRVAMAPSNGMYSGLKVYVAIALATSH